MSSYSHNEVTLIGNVGADPEVRATTSGARVATFSLATSRRWTNAAGERQEKTEWHRLVAWNPRSERGFQLADFVEKYVAKGSKVFVKGEIEYRQWQDKDNNTRYSTEIRVAQIGLLDKREGEAGGSRPAAAPAQTRDSKPAPTPAPAPQSNEDDFPFDEDLPF